MKNNKILGLMHLSQKTNDKNNSDLSQKNLKHIIQTDDTRQQYSKCRKVKFVESNFDGKFNRKRIKLNPFDLANPDQKYSDFNDFISSKRKKITASCQKNSNQIKDEYFDCNSCDSGFETENSCDNIFSFVKETKDTNSCLNSSNLSNNIRLDDLEKLSTQLKLKSNPIIDCSSATGYVLPVVAESCRNICIPQISILTLANILCGNHKLNNKITIFDCRFPYEYSGGHIIKSINVYNKQILLQTMFPISETSQSYNPDENASFKKKLKQDDSIYIFYCEFSSFRAPSLAECIRELDRYATFSSRKLLIPNIYILCKGYNEFFHTFPQLCSPQEYVSMNQTRCFINNNRYLIENYLISSQKSKKQYINEIQETEKKYKLIKTKSMKHNDILELFSSHPIIGRS